MVQVNRTHTVTSSIQVALFSACLLACGFMLSGCGDSPSAEVNKTAVDKSDKASRLTASAGDVRPSQDLSTRVDNLSGGAESRNEGVAQIEKDIKKLTGTDAKVYAPYIQQLSVTEDLKAANTLIQDALRNKSENSQINGLLQAQSAHLANQQAQIKLTNLEKQLRDFAQKAADIQSYCQRVTALGQEAALIEARKNASPKDLATSLQNAQADAEKAKAAVTEKTQAVEAVKNEIDTKTAQARKIYDQANTDQQAADQAKGVESIDAFKKAMDLKGQADQISMEVAQLQPKLKEAQTDLALAKIQQSEADEAVKIITATKNTVENNAQTASQQAAALRQQVTMLIEDSKTGLRAQVASFKTASKDIETDVADAIKNAEAASKGYGDAVASYKAYRSKTMSPESGNPPTGPLAQAVSDVQAESLLTLFQATARYRVGQANMLSASAAGLQDVVSKSVSTAYTAAGSSSEALPTTADAGKTAKDNAQKAFQEVVTKAQGVVKTSSIKETSPVKWLGYTMEAVAHQGLYTLTNDNEEKKAASKAADDAMSRNPALGLTGLTNQ